MDEKVIRVEIPAECEKIKDVVRLMDIILNNERLAKIAQVLSQLDEQELEKVTPIIEGMAIGFKAFKEMEDKKKEAEENG